MMKRSQWRGIEAETIEFTLEDTIDFSKLDIVLLGGGSDREQMIVCSQLRNIQKDFKSYVEDGGSVLAVCGGYQLLGHYYKTEEGTIEGLSLVDLYTEQGSPRLIDNIVLENKDFLFPSSDLKIMEDVLISEITVPLEKFYTDTETRRRSNRRRAVQKCCRHLSPCPLLPKNPHICDYLLSNALKRKYGKGESGSFR